MASDQAHGFAQIMAWDAIGSERYLDEIGRLREGYRLQKGDWSEQTQCLISVGILSKYLAFVILPEFISQRQW